MSTEIDNRMVWDGSSVGHYEVWYLTGNDPKTETGYWIRYTLESPLHGPAYAQLWFACFDKRNPANNIAINKRFPISDESSNHPFAFVVGDSRLGHDRATGRLQTEDSDISWDLRWEPSQVTLRQLPPLFYQRGGLADTTVLTPNPSIAVTGSIVMGDRTVHLDGAKFGQTHIWGSKHASSWAWGHCNGFSDHDDAVFEFLSVRLRRGPVITPPLTMATLLLDGHQYSFNRLRDLPRSRSTWSTGRVSFTAYGPLSRLEGEFSCRPKDMILAQYADPDGEPSYCANTEVADLQLILSTRTGIRDRYREQAELCATGSGHFEIARRQRDPAIGKDHVAI